MQRYMSRWLFGSSATDDDELLDGDADSNSPSWYSPSGYVHRKYNSLVDAQLDKFMVSVGARRGDPPPRLRCAVLPQQMMSRYCLWNSSFPIT